MAKSLDDIKPKTGIDKWRDSVLWKEMPKSGTWYTFRLVGPVYSMAQHWVKFTSTKTNKPSSFPIDCLAWSDELESVDPEKYNHCPGCVAGIKPGIKYLFNVIDRGVQKRGDTQYIRGFDMPPTAMKKILELNKLNVVNGTPMSVANPDYGCDLHIQWLDSSGSKGYGDWAIQKGDRTPLNQEERSMELFDFESIYVPGDAASARQSLVRVGYFKDVPAETVPDAPRTYMPPAGAQLPPAINATATIVGVAPTVPSPVMSVTPGVVPQTQTTQPLQTMMPQVQTGLPVVPPSTNGPGGGSTVSVTSLGGPPQSSNLDRPDCFGGFLGEIKCIKCPHRAACLQATEEKSR